MNPKVKAFIENAQEKQQIQTKQERDKLLVSLGLTDGVERKYAKEWDGVYQSWDDEKQMYYYDAPVPISVTDEEYELIKMCVKQRGDKCADESDKRNGAERFLSVVNTIGLVAGLLYAVAMLFMGLRLALMGVCLAIVMFISWAMVKVVLNISNNLHDINAKMK